MRKFLTLFSFFLFFSTSAIANETLYDYTAHLVDQNGKTVGLDVFRGHPVVISMFYASCNYTCPLLINALKKLDAQLDKNARANTRILLISFDPENDTPKVLADLAAKNNLDLDRWKLVSPAKKEVRDLAALLEFSYRAIPGGGFNHTSSLTLLDPLGAKTLHEEGLSDGVESIIQKLKH